MSSSGVWEEGRLELALPFGVVFSMNTAISSLNSVSRAWNRARESAFTLPSAHSVSNCASRASNSSRNECRLTVAMTAQCSTSTAIIAPSTARRSG